MMFSLSRIPVRDRDLGHAKFTDRMKMQTFTLSLADQLSNTVCDNVVPNSTVNHILIVVVRYLIIFTMGYPVVKYL